MKGRATSEPSGKAPGPPPEGAAPGNDSPAPPTGAAARPTRAGASDKGATPSANRADARWVVEVVAKFEGPLTQFVARITGDVERARDVVQEAFLKLIEQPRASVEPHLAEWLYTVCRNRAVDVRRKENRMMPLGDTSADALGPPPGRAAGREGGRLSPADAAEQKESAARVLQMLAHLPENQQECIRLKLLGGLSYKEISSVTRLSVTNVGFLIHTGLKALRQRLNPGPAKA